MLGRTAARTADRSDDDSRMTTRDRARRSTAQRSAHRLGAGRSARADAHERLGRPAVKRAVATRSSSSAPEGWHRTPWSTRWSRRLPEQADAACAACSTPPASCCTPISAGRRCPRRPRGRDGRGRRLRRRRVRPRHGRRAARGRGTLGRAAPPRCRTAGDVHVVNNGAAALVLATTALAGGRRGAGQPG